MGKPINYGKVNYMELVKIEKKGLFMPWYHWQKKIVVQEKRKER